MNYKESKKILAKIKKAKKILIGCHKGPDADTIGSGLSLYQVLKNWKKEVRIICPSEVSPSLKFLPFYEKIENVDFGKFKFGDYELLVSLDTPSPDYLTGSKKIRLPKIPIIVIDHHITNPKYGYINLIDSETSSAAEVLYLVFKDWRVKLTKSMATTLLTGIISDTGVFHYPSVTPQTFDIAMRLMNLGADKNEIIFNIGNSIELNRLKLWGEMLKRMEIDSKHKFAWSAIPFEAYKGYSKTESGRESFSSMFGHVVKNTDFSIVMTEEHLGSHSISLRSRTNFDVSKLAVSLGGGGHKAASGAKIEGMVFEEAVEKVLQLAKKFAKKR